MLPIRGEEHMAKDQIVALSTKQLWAILRSTNSMTQRFANELTWAKAELRRRGADTVGF